MNNYPFQQRDPLQDFNLGVFNAAILLCVLLTMLFLQICSYFRQNGGIELEEGEGGGVGGHDGHESPGGLQSGDLHGLSHRRTAWQYSSAIDSALHADSTGRRLPLFGATETCSSSQESGIPTFRVTTSCKPRTTKEESKSQSRSHSQSAGNLPMDGWHTIRRTIHIRPTADHRDASDDGEPMGAQGDAASPRSSSRRGDQHGQGDDGGNPRRAKGAGAKRR